MTRCSNLMCLEQQKPTMWRHWAEKLLRQSCVLKALLSWKNSWKINLKILLESFEWSCLLFCTSFLGCLFPLMIEITEFAIWQVSMGRGTTVSVRPYRQPTLGFHTHVSSVFGAEGVRASTDASFGLRVTDWGYRG